MRAYLLLLLAATSTCFSLPSANLPSPPIVDHNYNAVQIATSILNSKYNLPLATVKPLNEIKAMLQASTLNSVVISKVLTTLSCARAYNTNQNTILTIIDYSLPSSEKRLWVFDMDQGKLLFHTYVSHGIKSGALISSYFSNKNDSKASSIGVYKTDKAYSGRHGLSLKLEGMDRTFNDNAANRAVVMHGGWYVDEDFIKKYGRPGRSWGCPAVPDDLIVPIINAIKENSLLVIYYPSDNWFLKSKFLNCNNFSPLQTVSNPGVEPTSVTNNTEQREDILFADINKNNKREENEPVVVVTADNYQRIFHTQAPLTRMLRRQINNVEYIALSNMEFKKMIDDNNQLVQKGATDLNSVYFVIPVVKMDRGYYATEMHIVNFGKIKEGKSNTDTANNLAKSYIVYFEAKPFINIKSTNGFIRWLGL